MEYGRLSETLLERDKTSVGSTKSTFPEYAMVRAIPKDHMGLYLSDPFTHGRQSQIAEVDKMSESMTEDYWFLRRNGVCGLTSLCMVRKAWEKRDLK